MTDIDPLMDDGVIEQTFKLIDEDGSGTVSYAEFRKHMWRRFQPAMDGAPLTLAGKVSSFVRRVLCIKTAQARGLLKRFVLDPRF